LEIELFGSERNLETAAQRHFQYCAELSTGSWSFIIDVSAIAHRLSAKTLREANFSQESCDRLLGAAQSGKSSVATRYVFYRSIFEAAVSGGLSLRDPIYRRSAELAAPELELMILMALDSERHEDLTFVLNFGAKMLHRAGDDLDNNYWRSRSATYEVLALLGVREFSNRLMRKLGQQPTDTYNEEIAANRKRGLELIAKAREQFSGDTSIIYRLNEDERFLRDG
jgi:hypothetical protein